MRSRLATTSALVIPCLLIASCSSDTKGTGARIDGDTADSTTAASAPTPTDAARATTGTSPNTPDVAASTVEWEPCDDPKAEDPVLDCATIPVPLDYGDPDSEQIEIALVRVPATDPDDRVGAVVFNPGGPGGSGFDYVAQGGSAFAEALGVTDFDLIGFDPRGVDRSNGIRCLTDAEQDATTYLDTSPDSLEEQAALDAARAAFDDACTTKYADTLRFYSTEATARDVDVLRSSLGDDQISLLGISYGTYLFAMYATLFPDHVRAMVLDSAYEPTGDTIEESYTTQLVGFEQAFNHWSAWCQQTEVCAFRSADVGADWDTLSAELDATPVPTADGRSANQAVMETATISALYSESQWPLLAEALADVRNGDGTLLFRLADVYVGRSPDGTYTTIEQAGGIIRCASGIDLPLPDDPASLIATMQSVAPRFSRGLTVEDFEDTCATLVPEVTPPALAYDGDAPIVVVGGSNDPATPFRWAEEMDAAMGPSATLVSYTGEGHGSIVTSTCVTEIETAVFVDLELPDADTVCEPDPAVERPGWWDAIPVPEGIGDLIADPTIAEALGLGATTAYSEARVSAVGPAEALNAYDAALESADFEVLSREEPVPGVVQGVYLEPGGEIFSVLAIGPAGLADPELGLPVGLVAKGQTLVILLTFPT